MHLPDLLFIFILNFIHLSSGQEIIPKELKCVVCEKIISKMEEAINKEGHNKYVAAESFRIDSKGNTVKKSAQNVISETYLMELSSNICAELKDYVRVRHKKTGKLSIISLMNGSEMNPLIGEVDIVQDADLNKSIELYCEEIANELEEEIIHAFQKYPGKDIYSKVCSEIGQFCPLPPPEEYKFEDEL